MSERTGLSVALLGQAVFFSIVLLTIGLPRMVFFGLFWVATLATLLSILTCKRWFATEWIVFGAFSSATITAVLFSSNTLVDTTGVSVPVIGLLLVAAIISAIPDKKHKKRRIPAQQIIPNIFYAVPGSNKYHRKDCRMLHGKQDVQAFLTEDGAHDQGKSPCSICF